MENVTKIVAALFGAVLSFFCSLPPIAVILTLVMSLDYATGIVCGLMGVSPKSATGGLSSKTAFTGLLKKVLILIIVGLSALIDYAIASNAGVTFTAVTSAVCLWFIASEGISIIENAAEIGGVNVPPILRRALDVLRGTDDEPPDR